METGEGFLTIDIAGFSDKSPEPEFTQEKTNDAALSEAVKARGIRTTEDLTKVIANLTRALETNKRSVQDPFTGQYIQRKELEERRSTLRDWKDSASITEGAKTLQDVNAALLKDTRIDYIQDFLDRTKPTRVQGAQFTPVSQIPSEEIAEENISYINKFHQKSSESSKKRQEEEHNQDNLFDAAVSSREASKRRHFQKLKDTQQFSKEDLSYFEDLWDDSVKGKVTAGRAAGLGGGTAVGRGSTKPKVVTYAARRIGQGLAHAGAALGSILPGAGGIAGVLSPALTGLGAAGVTAGAVAAGAGIAAAIGAYKVSPYIQGYFGRQEAGRQSYIDYEKMAGESDLQHETSGWAKSNRVFLSKMRRSEGKAALYSQQFAEDHGVSGLDITEESLQKLGGSGFGSPLWEFGGRKLFSKLAEERMKIDKEKKEEAKNLLEYSSGKRGIRDPEVDVMGAPDDVGDFMRRGEIDKWGILSLVPATLRAYGRRSGFERGKYAGDSPFHRGATDEELNKGSFDERGSRSFGTPLSSEYGNRLPMTVSRADFDDYNKFLHAGEEVDKLSKFFGDTPAVLFSMGINGQASR
jgi:hypothetical protein